MHLSSYFPVFPCIQGRQIIVIIKVYLFTCKPYNVNYSYAYLCKKYLCYFNPLLAIIRSFYVYSDSNTRLLFVLIVEIDITRICHRFIYQIYITVSVYLCSGSRFTLTIRRTVTRYGTATYSYNLHVENYISMHISKYR